MKILVTGAAGFIGRNLVMRLATLDNIKIWALDQFDLPPCLDGLETVVPIKDHVGTTDILTHHRFDCVIHMAGSAGVRMSDEFPLHYIDNNVRATTHLFEEARKSGVPLVIYASSSSAYGDSMDVPLREDAPFHVASSIYGLSKQMGEKVAEYYYNRHGVRSVGFRFFTVYGPYGRDNMAIGKFTKSILANEPITIFGDGLQIRDFTHVDDVVDAIIAATQSDKVQCEILNVGAGDSCTVKELVELIKTACERPDYDKISYEPRHPADVTVTLASNKKLIELLGVTPKVKLVEGLQDYIRHLKTH